MQTKTVTVTSDLGDKKEALMPVCEVCNGDVFHLFVFDGHNHMQCANPFCGESYCQGSGPCNDVFCEGQVRFGEKPDDGKCPCGEEH